MATGFRLDHCTAVITGASSGLGAEFARQLAPRARTLLLAARREEVLQEVKTSLLALNPALTVHVCACDIATEAGRARLVECVDIFDVKPNLLVNNAGMGDYGSFASAPAERLRGQIELNISAVVLLTHALMPRLVATPESPAAVLNVSSLAGDLPMPDLAVYGASKAFVTSFSEALRVELADQNIIVSAVCPGPTPTDFGKNARRESGEDTNRSGQEFLRVTPDVVVARGLRALERREACVFPGLGVSIAGPLFRIMPRALLRWVIERRHKKSA
jgi:short-subunit dehydrogenase